MLRYSIVPFTLLLALAGCAQGGGDDAGPGRMDAGESAMDAGEDAGNTDEDAGNTDEDAGTTEEDGGPGGMDASFDGGVDAGFDGGVDAGFDGGFDGGFDSGPPPECITAADCNDGLACNGVERCEFGSCAAGTPVTCDDGIGCTRNACVEGTPPSCSYTPDDTLCPGTQVCGASGCMASCPETPCRLVSPQCGCPTGQGCYVNATARMCRAAGTRPTGATCTGVGTCTPGNICINVARSGSAVNMCNRFCNLDADCAGGICLYTLDDGMGGSVPGVTICTTSCDPILQTGCPAGTGCSIFQESAGAMRFFTDCVAPFGAGGQGSSCTDQADCRAGLGCFGTPGTCLTWCDRPGMIGAAGGCALGQACFGFMTPIRVGTTEYGVCDTFP